MAKPYPQQFKQDVLTIAKQGNITLSQLAKDFGISISVLHKWIKQSNIDSGKQSGITSAMHEENRILRKRNKLLEQENEVLRAAAAYLSQANIQKK